MRGTFTMTRTDDSTTSLGTRGPAAFNELMKREQESVQITLNQPLFVPGLFQVEGYAAEMIGRLRTLKPGDPELENRVGVRMRRAAAFAQRLRGEAPPKVSVVVDECVLRRVVGGPEVMRTQLGRLRELSELPSVQLAIVPLKHGAHPGLLGSFEVHEDPHGDTAVFFEAAHESEILTNDEAQVDRCRGIVSSLMASVVTGSDARALLETISSGL
jgi:hypothetical protein